MKNPYKEYKRNRDRADHFEELYLDTNHQLVDFKKKFETQFQTGHFYSPYPDLKEIKKRAGKIFDRRQKSVPGIDLNDQKQVSLLNKLAAFYDDMPYTAEKTPGWRYYFENSAYDYTDATMLFGILRHFKPKRVVEIGSGYSSALMMDVNEHFLDHKMALTFVEPYPKLLKSLMTADDKKRYKIIGQNLSEVSNTVFTKLQAGDILFVDSTHVSKVGSDVNQIFFDILPLLKKGVIIHVHDIFYPFEYPLEWIEETRAWTEGYLVRAFLHNNKEYEIIMFNHYMNLHHKKELKKLMPHTSKNIGSGIWLRKK